MSSVSTEQLFQKAKHCIKVSSAYILHLNLMEGLLCSSSISQTLVESFKGEKETTWADAAIIQVFLKF